MGESRSPRRVRRLLIAGVLLGLLGAFLSIPTTTQLVWLRTTALCEKVRITGLTEGRGLFVHEYRFRPSDRRFLTVEWDGEVHFSARGTLGFVRGWGGFSLADGRECELITHPDRTVPEIREREAP